MNDDENTSSYKWKRVQGDKSEAPTNNTAGQVTRLSRASDDFSKAMFSYNST